MPPLSLAQWSLHRMIFAGELHPLDFPAMSLRTFGIDAVEYVNRCLKDHYADDDLGWVPAVRSRCDDLGVRSLLIMIDRQGDLGDPDPVARRAAVERHYKWIEAARRLGCHSIRVNARSAAHLPPAEQHALVVDGLARLTEFAAPHEINVLVENHGGLSSNGAWLAGVMRAVNERVPGSRCGTLPDFGNFCMDWDRREDPSTWYDRYLGVAEMMPWAKAVSAKSNDFNDRGEEVHTDFARMMRIVRDAGYSGHIGIEYEGASLEEVEGVRKTKALLERVMLANEPANTASAG
jgi:L-ribulose-5-phosphate 3-epimerase